MTSPPPNLFTWDWSSSSINKFSLRTVPLPFIIVKPLIVGLGLNSKSEDLISIQLPFELDCGVLDASIIVFSICELFCHSFRSSKIIWLVKNIDLSIKIFSK